MQAASLAANDLISLPSQGTKRVTIMAGQKGLLDKAQDKATAVAKKGAKEVSSVASEALSAAAAAAAAAAGGVVLDRMTGALQKGKEKVEEAKPTRQMAAEPNVAPKKAMGKKSKLAPKKKTRTPSKMKSTRGAKKSKAKAQSKKKSRRR
jgi:hypothetical protein